MFECENLLVCTISNMEVSHNLNQTSLPGCLSLSGNVPSSLNAPPGLPSVIIWSIGQARLEDQQLIDPYDHLHEEARAECLPDVHVIVL